MVHNDPDPQTQHPVSRLFSVCASAVAHAAGKPLSFAICLVIVVFWAASGPLFGFSDTWQLVINTGTTLITFLMVFLVQNTQNRDSAAIQLKLDESIRAMPGAHNALLDLEELTEHELNHIRLKYGGLAGQPRENRVEGLLDIDTPDVDD